MTEPLLPNFRWVIPDVLAGVSRPLSADAMVRLHELGIRALLSLTEAPLPDHLLQAVGFRTVHIPVPDFSAPTQDQIDEALLAIERWRDEGMPVAVHCGAGLGRTGTILACYLVAHGVPATTAIARVRSRQPGSIETAEQQAAVIAYGAATRSSSVPMSNTEWRRSRFRPRAGRQSPG